MDAALIDGGTIQYDPFYGQPQVAAFHPASNTFTNVQNMARGRWCPTVLTLGDGRVMAFSGLNETGGTNTAVQVYTVGSGWSQQYPFGTDQREVEDVVHSGQRSTDRHGSSERQHRPAGLLHAFYPEQFRCTLRGDFRSGLIPSRTCGGVYTILPDRASGNRHQLQC